MKVAVVVAVVAIVVVLAFSFLTKRNPHLIGVEGDEYEIVSTSTDPDEADQQVLDNMLNDGADLSKVTTVQFILNLPTRESAADAARHIDSIGGFNVEYRESSGDWEWMCLATKRMSLEGRIIFEHSDLFERIAAKYGGEYDGWEAEVIE
jgi:regulator of RNase E activity RraB